MKISPNFRFVMWLQRLRAGDCLLILTFMVILVRPSIDIEVPSIDDIPGNAVIHNPTQKNSHEVRAGIDVSFYQGAISWPEVVGGIDLVYLKATDGSSYRDPRFFDNAHALAKYKLPVGAYHFFEPDDDPLEQARNYLDTVKGQALTLRPVLDVEINKGQKPQTISASVKIWLEHVEKETGCKPLIYSYASFWDTYLGKTFNDYPFWLADYSEKPHPPQTRPDYQLWQYTDLGHVNGIVHAVDKDIFAGTASVFDRLLCKEKPNIDEESA